MVQGTQNMLAKVMSVVGALKEDVDVLKEDRPHKTPKSSTDFSVVSEPGNL